MALKEEFHFHYIYGTFLLVLRSGDYFVLFVMIGEQIDMHLFLYDYALYQYDL